MTSSHVLKQELWTPCEGNPGYQGVDADPTAACPQRRTEHRVSPVVTRVLSRWSRLSTPHFRTLGTFHTLLCIVTSQEGSVAVSSQLLRPWSFPAVTHLHTQQPSPPTPRPKVCRRALGNTCSEVSVTPNLVHVTSRPVWPSISFECTIHLIAV